MKKILKLTELNLSYSLLDRALKLFEVPDIISWDFVSGLLNSSIFCYNVMPDVVLSALQSSSKTRLLTIHDAVMNTVRLSSVPIKSNNSKDLRALGEKWEITVCAEWNCNCTLIKWTPLSLSAVKCWGQSGYFCLSHVGTQKGPVPTLWVWKGCRPCVSRAASALGAGCSQEWWDKDTAWSHGCGQRICSSQSETQSLVWGSRRKQRSQSNLAHRTSRA